MVLFARRAVEVQNLLRQFIFSFCRHHTSAGECKAYEVCASPQASESSYGIAEDILVLAIVIAELEFREILRQVLFAHIVIGPDDPAFEQAPKIVNISRVDRSANVFMTAMVNGLVPITHVIQRGITRRVIRRYQFNIVAHGSRTKLVSVLALVFSITLQTTFPLREIAPMTPTLPLPPVTWLRLSA